MLVFFRLYKMSEKIKSNRLENKEYFINELRYNINLKKWNHLKTYFAIIEYENKNIFLQKDSNLHILNTSKSISDIDIRDFLSTLLSSYPENLSDDFVKNFIIYSVNGSKKTYDTKKKGYFINRLDKFLQDILGIENTSIDNFKEPDRKLIHFTRGKTPNFKNDVKINKIEDDDFIGLVYFSFKLYKLNNNANLNKLLKLAESSFKNKCNKEVFYIYDLFRTYFDLNEVNKGIKSLENIKLPLIIHFFSQLINSINMIKNSCSNTKEKFLFFITKDIFKEIENITYNSIIKNENICFKKVNTYFELIHIYLNRFLNDEHFISEKDLNNEIKQLIYELEKEVDIKHNFINKHEMDKKNFSKFNINYDGTYCEQPDWNKLIKSYSEIQEIEKEAEEIWITTSNLDNLINIMGKNHINKININSKFNKKYNIFYKTGEKDSIFKENKYLSLYKLEILENIFIPFEYTILIYNPNDIQNLCGFYSGLFDEFNKENYDRFYISIYYKNLIKLTDFLIENIS